MLTNSSNGHLQTFGNYKIQSICLEFKRSKPKGIKQFKLVLNSEFIIRSTGNEGAEMCIWLILSTLKHYQHVIFNMYSLSPKCPSGFAKVHNINPLKWFHGIRFVLDNFILINITCTTDGGSVLLYHKMPENFEKFMDNIYLTQCMRIIYPSQNQHYHSRFCHFEIHHK